MDAGSIQVSRWARLSGDHRSAAVQRLILSAVGVMGAPWFRRSSIAGQAAWPLNRFRQALGCAECDAGLKEISANIMVVSANQTAGQPPLEPTH
jgi:hypothetical protein